MATTSLFVGLIYSYFKLHIILCVFYSDAANVENPRRCSRHHHLRITLLMDQQLQFIGDAYISSRLWQSFYRASICEGGLGSRNSVCSFVCLSVTRVDCDKTK